MAMDAKAAIVDAVLLKQSVVVLAVVIVAFVVADRFISSPRPSRWPARRC